jgi:K+-transporting ATPase KdpF subunit
MAAADACSNRESRNGATTVSGTGVLANVVGGVLALLLIIYLFVALVKPEKF